MSDTGQFRAVGGPAVAQRTAAQPVYPGTGRPPMSVAPPPPGGAYAGHRPSGLFPAKQAQGVVGPNGAMLRPIYREMVPVTAGKAAIGVLAGTLWMGLFGLLATSAQGYVWWTIIAAVLAWPVLAVLTRFGDRGVAAGAAVSTGFGLAIAALVVIVRGFAGDWPL